jgi:hypothetical protein
MRGARIIAGLAVPACFVIACSRSLTPDPGGAGASGMIPTTGGAGRDAGGGNVAPGDGGAAARGGGVPSGQGGGAGGAGGFWETGAGGVISIGGFSGGGGQAGAGVASPLGPDCRDCTRAPIGAPTWEPVGAVIFREPVVGTDDDVPFLGTVLGPNHLRYATVGAFGPGSPHAGPYDGELDALLSAQHLFPLQQFPYHSVGGGPSIAIMVVIRPSPGAAVGRSADFESGPIIPNALFPLRVAADLQPPMLDPAFDATIPGTDAFMPPIAADGASHAFLRFRASTTFARAQIGRIGAYALNVTVTDATGAGWTLTIVFSIVGDPVP